MDDLADKTSCEDASTLTPRIRFLPLEVTDAMHGIAVAPEKYPLCRYEAINHASGALVAAVVVKATLGYLTHLRDACDVVRGELLLEAEFTREKLAEHHQLLSSLEYNWGLLTRPDLSSVAGGSDILLVLFRKIPIGEAILGRIYELHEAFKREILTPIAIAALRKDKGRKGGQTEIEAILKRIAFKLDALGYGVEESISRTNEVLEKIKEDWDQDVSQVWCNSACQPVKRRRCSSSRGDQVQINDSTRK